MRARWIGTGALLLMVTLVGACGGSGGNKTSVSGSKNGTGTPTNNGGGKSSSKTATETACKFISESDASTLFGTAAKQKADASSASGAASLCIWEADDSANHGYLLQIRIYDDEAHYGESLFTGAQKIAGIGDKAFVVKAGGLAGVDVQFLKGGSTYSVNYSITNVLAKTRKNASDQADQLVALVKGNLSRL